MIRVAFFLFVGTVAGWMLHAVLWKPDCPASKPIDVRSEHPSIDFQKSYQEIAKAVAITQCEYTPRATQPVELRTFMDLADELEKNNDPEKREDLIQLFTLQLKQLASDDEREAALEIFGEIPGEGQ
jgi:hypothetical protein